MEVVVFISHAQFVEQNLFGAFLFLSFSFPLKCLDVSPSVMLLVSRHTFCFRFSSLLKLSSFFNLFRRSSNFSLFSKNVCFPLCFSFGENASKVFRLL